MARDDCLCTSVAVIAADSGLLSITHCSLCVADVVVVAVVVDLAVVVAVGLTASDVGALWENHTDPPMARIGDYTKLINFAAVSPVTNLLLLLLLMVNVVLAVTP